MLVEAEKRDRPYKPKDKIVNAVVNRGHASSSDNDGVTPVKGFRTRYQNEDDYVINRIQNIQNAATNKGCIRLNIKLNEVKVKAVLDTGSPISIIPMYITDIIQPETFRSLSDRAKYADFNRNDVKLTGEFEANTEYEGKHSVTRWKAIEGNKEPIIGMDNIAALGDTNNHRQWNNFHKPADR